MPYIVTKRVRRGYQMTFDDLLDPYFDLKAHHMLDTPYTFTAFRETIPERLKNQIDINELIFLLQDFNRVTEFLHRKPREEWYRSYCIPKRSGGLRPIDEPCGELKNAISALKTLFEERFYALHHTAAYAYVKGRSNVDMARYHQAANSHWYAHFDFSNFFGSVTLEYTMDTLAQIYPFSEVCKTNSEDLKKAVDLCFFKGGLPQGTPISPLLTNLVMIPIDAALYKRCNEKDLHYSRYADDLVISGYRKFDPKECEKDILEVLDLFNAPMKLNAKKTTFGSRAGHNMVVGLLINQDNEVTIGSRKRNVFRAMVHNFLRDYQAGKPWSIEDTQHLVGLSSYYRNVNAADTDGIINKYNQKFHCNFEAIWKNILKEATTLV